MPVRLTIRLTSRGGRDAIDGWAKDDAGQPYLKARVSVPPVDNGANAALIKLIAKALKIPNGAVRIVAGDHARLKHLELDGITHADLESVLGRAS